MKKAVLWSAFSIYFILYLMEKTILIDSHVHVHDIFDDELFLNNALRNFKYYHSKMNDNSLMQGMLLLTESRGEKSFEKIKGLSSKENKSISIVETRETESVKAIFPDGSLIYIISGKQIVTAENLEVLALGTVKDFEEKKPITETIIKVAESGAIPVIPWGFGKWTGKRRKIIEYLMFNKNLPEFYWGDNSGRLGFMKSPADYEKENSNKRRVLPGSDPLPFANQIEKPGSFGFYIKNDPEPDYPFKSLKSFFSKKENEIFPFGKLENIYRFFVSQILMQIKKRI